MTAQLPTLLVIRHGETQWNLAGRLQGHKDTPLTLNGVRQAMAIATRLSGVVDELENASFWVSPLARARQTASILADVWDKPFALFHVAPQLIERSYGAWEGHTLEEVQQTLPAQHAAYTASPWTYAVPGGESAADLTRRIETWVRGLDSSVPHVAVCHSGCLRALRGLYGMAGPDQVLSYREPQTTAFLLGAQAETMLEVSPAGLRAFACDGTGLTVPI